MDEDEESDRKSERDDPRLALGLNGMNQGGQWRVMVMIMRKHPYYYRTTGAILPHGPQRGTLSLSSLCVTLYSRFT